MSAGIATMSIPHYYYNTTASSFGTTHYDYYTLPPTPTPTTSAIVVTATQINFILISVSCSAAVCTAIVSGVYCYRYRAKSRRQQRINALASTYGFAGGSGSTEPKGCLVQVPESAVVRIGEKGSRRVGYSDFKFEEKGRTQEENDVEDEGKIEIAIQAGQEDGVEDARWLADGRQRYLQLFEQTRSPTVAQRPPLHQQRNLRRPRQPQLHQQQYQQQQQPPPPPPFKPWQLPCAIGEELFGRRDGSLTWAGSRWEGGMDCLASLSSPPSSRGDEISRFRLPLTCGDTTLGPGPYYLRGDDGLYCLAPDTPITSSAWGAYSGSSTSMSTAVMGPPATRPWQYWSTLRSPQATLLNFLEEEPLQPALIESELMPAVSVRTVHACITIPEEQDKEKGKEREGQVLSSALPLSRDF
ncbi:hypothetical protein BGX33_001006 [Mortierella sp. NVP41]|nr:hypothetical protein BGX33_001006 [Mortierella sp. NVP41]